MRQKQQQRQPLAELIDTQWDVNKDNQTVNSMPDAELIDTQWDVNDYVVSTMLDAYERINRYIVGCKYNRCVLKKSKRARINRYIVGCK